VRHQISSHVTGDAVVAAARRISAPLCVWPVVRFLALVAVALALLACSARKASAATFSWSAPVLVDEAAARTTDSSGITALSCPSMSLCVALDEFGNVLTSTSPGDPGSWRKIRPPVPISAAAVSCPSVSLCVAVGVRRSAAGWVLVSTDPVGGAAAWRAAPLSHVEAPTAVSCPSASLCVGVDLNGDVLSSTDPTGGSRAWRAAHVDTVRGFAAPGPILEGVSCPSASLCIAADDEGGVLTSTNPTSGSSAWRRVRQYLGAGLAGVSCPSVSLCVLASGDIGILSSTDPTGGRSAWTPARSTAPLAQFWVVSCPIGLVLRRGGPRRPRRDIDRP
jgi:hypothetical protein